MSKKPTGLISSAMADRPKREARNAFIDKWEKENPDYVQELKKLSKDQLIHLVIQKWIGPIYDKVLAQFPNDNDAEAELDALRALGSQLLNGSPEEKRSALAKWEAEMMAIAGDNINKVAEVARIAGATGVRIDEQPKIKAFKARGVNLKNGQIKGQKTQKDYAAETWVMVAKINADLLKHPDTARWKLDRRADYIANYLKQNGRKQINKKPYLASTIVKRITGKG